MQVILPESPKAPRFSSHFASYNWQLRQRHLPSIPKYLFDHLDRSQLHILPSLKEEIVSLKSKKQTPISPPNTRSTPGSGTSTTAPKITGTQASRPINDAYSIFSDVFAKVKTDDGWVQDTMFVNALNKLYPDFRSASYWKGKLHRTVDAYSDVIEKKGDEKNPKKFYGNY